MHGARSHTAPPATTYSNGSNTSLNLQPTNQQRAAPISQAAAAEQQCAVREQDAFMPIANVIRIMRKVVPSHAKSRDDAKETIQECVSEYISFITSEANDALPGVPPQVPRGSRGTSAAPSAGPAPCLRRGPLGASGGDLGVAMQRRRPPQMAAMPLAMGGDHLFISIAAATGAAISLARVWGARGWAEAGYFFLEGIRLMEEEARSSSHHSSRPSSLPSCCKDNSGAALLPRRCF
ncbi:uncharacterized protein A4U43_C05F22290 [Asparagus officinalis]|uniref:Transcription factor CBF/NF-Y/archaeal histone domain-containing protein n=1 Tax=Asparagus officinalis TaxID=4686 RepID=A0A5P1EUA1_ASPOF|nr:uncharacterized protein A4U43_C05F22290 [Asparagus officinalis]